MVISALDRNSIWSYTSVKFNSFFGFMEACKCVFFFFFFKLISGLLLDELAIVIVLSVINQIIEDTRCTWRSLSLTKEGRPMPKMIPSTGLPVDYGSRATWKVGTMVHVQNVRHAQTVGCPMPLIVHPSFYFIFSFICAVCMAISVIWGLSFVSHSFESYSIIVWHEICKLDFLSKN